MHRPLSRDVRQAQHREERAGHQVRCFCFIRNVFKVLGHERKDVLPLCSIYVMVAAWPLLYFTVLYREVGFNFLSV